MASRPKEQLERQVKAQSSYSRQRRVEAQACRQPWKELAMGATKQHSPTDACALNRTRGRPAPRPRCPSAPEPCRKSDNSPDRTGQFPGASGTCTEYFAHLPEAVPREHVPSRRFPALPEICPALFPIALFKVVKTKSNSSRRTRRFSQPFC